MPSVARLGDKTTGHDGFPSRLIISCSENVFVNGIGVARIGDKTTCNDTVAEGSENVFCN